MPVRVGRSSRRDRGLRVSAIVASLSRWLADATDSATVYPLWAAALGVSFFCLILALFQSNFYLGEAQNSYDHQDTQGHLVADDKTHVVERQTFAQKLARFWDL